MRNPSAEAVEPARALAWWARGSTFGCEQFSGKGFTVVRALAKALVAERLCTQGLALSRRRAWRRWSWHQIFAATSLG